MTKATAAYSDEIIPVGAVILCSTAMADALEITDYRYEILSSAGTLWDINNSIPSVFKPHEAASQQSGPGKVYQLISMLAGDG